LQGLKCSIATRTVRRITEGAEGATSKVRRLTGVLRLPAGSPGLDAA